MVVGYHPARRKPITSGTRGLSIQSLGTSALVDYGKIMTIATALLLAAALATGASNDLRPYAACRKASHAVHSGGCAWRSGSLFAVNGWYSTRVAFRMGRPGGVVIYQPGVLGPSEFIPAQARKIDIHVGDMSAVDGDYLVCSLRPLSDPSDPAKTLDTACLAGAKRLRVGTVAWAFSEAPTINRKRGRR